MTTARFFLAAGALSGFLAVAAGAFGAHGLRSRVTPDLLVIFETGARYQMYHALALCLLGLTALREPDPSALYTASGAGFLLGTLLFTGSLYLMTLSGERWLGAVTPLGGLGFLTGWLCFALWALRS